MFVLERVVRLILKEQLGSLKQHLEVTLISKLGLTFIFFNSEIVLDGANNTFVHFASSDVEIDGLTIDNRKGSCFA